MADSITTDALEIPGDLGWIALLVVLVAVAWNLGVLKRSAVRRATVAGAGVALVGFPVTVWLWNAYSLSNAAWAAMYYGVVLTVVSFVWFRGRARTGTAT